MRCAFAFFLTSILALVTSSARADDELDELACPAAPAIGASQEDVEAAARAVCDALRAEGARGSYEITLEVHRGSTFLGASDPWGKRVVLQVWRAESARDAAPQLAHRVLLRSPPPPSPAPVPRAPTGLQRWYLTGGRNPVVDAGAFVFGMGYLPAVVVAGGGAAGAFMGLFVCSFAASGECAKSVMGKAGPAIGTIVPIVGPFALYKIVEPHNRVWLYVDGAVQLTGALIAAVGVIRGDTREQPTTSAAHLRIVPWVALQSAGLSAMVVE